MSRGLGNRCRQLLDWLNEKPGQWRRVMDLAGDDVSARTSLNRAAHTLNRRGLVDLWRHKPCESEPGYLVAKSSGPKRRLPKDLQCLVPDYHRDECLLAYDHGADPSDWASYLDTIRTNMGLDLIATAARNGLNINQAKRRIEQGARNRRGKPTEDSHDDENDA